MTTSDQPPSDQPNQTKSMLNANTTQTINRIVNRDERKSKFFFIRRRPQRKVEREWHRPSDPQRYNELLMKDGFLTEDLIGGPLSEKLEADIRELDQHLLPHFWRVNQLAHFYQNRFYQYQWAFILAAFFTTALAATNVLLHAQGWTEVETWLGEIALTELLGFFTAIISGIAATVSFLDANQNPQKRWYKARAQAEGLRSLYFLFIARQRPFNLTSERERVQKLREKVLGVLRSTSGGQPVKSTTSQPQPPSSTSRSRPAQPDTPDQPS